MIKKKQELKKKNGDVKNKVKLQLSEGTKGSRDTITDKKTWYLWVLGPSRGDMSGSNVTWTIYISIHIILLNNTALNLLIRPHSGG